MSSLGGPTYKKKKKKITYFRPYCKHTNTIFLGLYFLGFIARQHKMNAKNYCPSFDSCYFTLCGMVLTYVKLTLIDNTKPCC